MIETQREKKAGRPMENNDFLFMLEMEKMKKDIDEIKNKGLPDLDSKIDKVETTLETKIGQIDKKVDKMDARLWAIIILLVAGLILPTVAKMYLPTPTTQEQTTK